jgi:hypothetical protein
MSQLAITPNPDFDHLREFLPKYVARLNANFLKTYNLPFVSADSDRGLMITGEPSDEDFQRLFAQLSCIRGQNCRVSLEMDRWIGQAIIDYAARHDTDWTSAVSQLDLPSHTGKSAKTLLKLPRIVSTLPDTIWQDCPNLTISHLDAATSFAGPDPTDTEATIRFAEKRDEMLQQASNKGNWTKKDITIAMRNIQLDLGITPSRPEAGGSVSERFNRLSVMLIDWEEDDFAAHGISRARCQEIWRDTRETLIERKIITHCDDIPGGFEPPFKEAEVVDETTTANEGEAEDEVITATPEPEEEPEETEPEATEDQNNEDE